jgi:hypothetical protein
MIQRLRPRIQQVVNTLLDEVAGKSEMEFMTEFANPLPVRVIAEMLGIHFEAGKFGGTGAVSVDFINSSYRGTVFDVSGFGAVYFYSQVSDPNSSVITNE